MHWTKAEKEAGHNLRKQGLTIQEIADHLGRTRSSVEGFFRWRKQSVDQRLRRNQRARYVYAQKKKGLSRRAPEFGRPDFLRPCPVAIADRDYRLGLPPRDLTASFFGDPPPGYSALECRCDVASPRPFTISARRQDEDRNPGIRSGLT